MKGRRGLVMVNTGPGKGKTTAALGAAVRAAGQGLSVIIIQFIKGDGRTGELKTLSAMPGLEIRQLGRGMVSRSKDLSRDREQARRAWDESRAAVSSGAYDLVVLDEICVALHFGFLEPGEVVEMIESRPPELHLILTGRHCPEEVLAAADTVTRMEALKHHFDSGIKAQPGIEF